MRRTVITVLAAVATTAALLSGCSGSGVSQQAIPRALVVRHQRGQDSVPGRRPAAPAQLPAARLQVHGRGLRWQAGGYRYAVGTTAGLEGQLLPRASWPGSWTASGPEPLPLPARDVKINRQYFDD